MGLKFNVFELDDQMNCSIVEPTILLIKEFSALWDVERNKCKDDKTGKLRLKAHKEFAYIYLSTDYRSRYMEEAPNVRVNYAREDAQLTEKEIKDPLLISAQEKYDDLQDSRVLRLLRTAEGAIDKMTAYFDSIDFTKKDELTGEIPDFNKVQSAINRLSETNKNLEELVYQVQKQKEKEATLRGGDDSEPGLFN